MKRDEHCDVLVIGSGSAALSAALRAAHGGLKVVVVEKTGLIGGTSAMSGAGTWIPDNHIAKGGPFDDSYEKALEYLRAASPVGWHTAEDHLWQAFVAAAPRMLAFLARSSPLKFRLVDEPDPMSERPGGSLGGRMLSPMPLSRRLARPFGNRIRTSTLPHIFTYQEIVEHDPYHHPVRAVLKLWRKLLWRLLTNSRGQGTALIVGLLKACIDAGCQVELNARAFELLVDEADGSIKGARLKQNGVERSFTASLGVVLATGGFEWDPSMMAEHFPGPVDRLGSPPTNEGDGHKMAASVGAKLDRMNQANIGPSLPTRYAGRLVGLPITFQVEPHCILVNRHGKRFVSEGNFNLGEALDERDALTGAPVHLPVWLVGDSRFLTRSAVFRWYARRQPGWVVTGETISDLASKMDIPADALTETVRRTNAFCDKGVDDDFARGESTWEAHKSHGDRNMGRIEKPPFVGIPFNRTIFGTKGGARTNSLGQVLSEDGSIIKGLYAAGLAMANPIGTRALGAGTTIGPNLTWGFICAETLLQQRDLAGKRNDGPFAGVDPLVGGAS